MAYGGEVRFTRSSGAHSRFASRFGGGGGGEVPAPLASFSDNRSGKFRPKGSELSHSKVSRRKVSGGKVS